MDQNDQAKSGGAQKAELPDANTEKAGLRRLNLRLTQQEWDKIHRLAANSTCRSMSEYARTVLSQKPVRVFLPQPVF